MARQLYTRPSLEPITSSHAPFPSRSAAAGLDHITPHQLRHTYATALVNAGVSLQALMALHGHISAEMSLRYGRLFDSTVRTEYERALTAAKAHLGTLPAEPSHGRTQLPIVDGDWKQAPAVKARLAGGFCIRAQVQGPCAYANICEHCPKFRTDTRLPARPGRPARRRRNPGP